nr:diverge_rpsU: rpsU-divergently transcribed [uncultured bacterium]
MTTTPEATATAAPESTSSIIESAIADLPDNGDTSDDLGVVDEPPSDAIPSGTSTSAPDTTTTGTAAPATVTPPVTQADVDELARELGITAEGTAKWTSRIAYSKIKKIVDARAAKTQEAHDTAIRQHTERVSQFEQQIAQFDRLVANPEQLITALAQVHPGYSKYATTPPATSAGAPPARIETMQDLQRVIDAQVAARLRPIEEDRQRQQTIAQELPRAQQRLAEAKTWPLFTESQGDILATLKANPGISLEAAYQKVVVPKLATQRDSIRQEVLAELNGRPRSTTVTSTVTGRTAPDSGPQDTTDIIWDAIRRTKAA